MTNPRPGNDPRPGQTLRTGAALALTAWIGACATPAASEPEASASVPGVDPAPPILDANASGLVWNRRAVEHLLNRAGFGGTQAEIEAGLAQSPEAFVAALFEPRAPWRRFEPELAASAGDRLDRAQLGAYADRWFAAMIDHRDPIRDHMTLFWHGFFTTSVAVVPRAYELINQHQLLRYHALESYADLLAAIVRDPAMLRYLDNDTNVAEHPNENLARELMELFSLGEGAYTEVDVREVARALTGYHGTRYGGFAFYPERHDHGEKTVLGVTGDLDADDVVAILLDQPACARWVAGKIIAYFEGPWPSIERLDRYAALFATSEYEVRPLLEALFLDPEFYRDEIVGARVQGPIEWTVAAVRKLGIEPPAGYVEQAAAAMGQRFYGPPGVEGWPQGEAWITGDALFARGNHVGALLDAFGLPDAGEAGSVAPVSAALGPVAGPAMASAAHELQDRLLPDGWLPRTTLAARLRAAGARSDEDIVAWLAEELLAIEPPVSTVDALLEVLARERDERGLGRTPLLETDGRDVVLRRLAHLLFSLPEAQLG